jgi:hypothetical protein
MSQSTKVSKDALAREGVLASRVRAGGLLDAESLAKSYAIPVDRVRQIITRNGGSHA